MKQKTSLQLFSRLWTLLYITCSLLLTGCNAAYKNLRPVKAESGCISTFKPIFTRTLYKTQVDVLNHHLSGILLIKSMPDSSTRVLFTMETGFKFFDFEFSKNGAFKVYYIIDKMNKKAVIKTLRKDFELALMLNIDNKIELVYTMNNLLYHRFTTEDAFDYYITDMNCSNLVRIEKANQRKTITTVIIKDYTYGIPDTIGISHHKVKFNIGLKRIAENARVSE